MTKTPAISYEHQIETYLNHDTLPYPFCPGCSHGKVLDQLNDALVRLQLDPRRVVMVSDIGCVGLSDKYFATHAFHGLHGRSITYATGIKLANPELKPIVLVGDGGFGIGGHHFLNAARRNIGVTVVVFNNLNFGMTGGQYSVTTPTGAVTSTTPQGHVEQPLDISGTVALNGAGFVARTTIFDDNLTDLMAEAIAYDGFSLVEIWELCVAYYAAKNDLRRKTVEKTMKQLGYESGVFKREERPEYTRSYWEANRERTEVDGTRHQRFPAARPGSLPPAASSPASGPPAEATIL
jgi:pyruvate/2-oxoacid:ferredoxin oxidoreductase beta subunit